MRGLFLSSSAFFALLHASVVQAALTVIWAPCLGAMLCRSLHPARHAAATLLRYQWQLQQQRQQQQPEACSEGLEVSGGGGDVCRGDADGLTITSVEHHSRQPQDWWVGARGR